MSQLKNPTIYYNHHPNPPPNLNASIIALISWLLLLEAVLYYLSMEAYNLLLKEFDESRSSKNFIPQVEAIVI